jgi:hypothetical protein
MFPMKLANGLQTPGGVWRPSDCANDFRSHSLTYRYRVIEAIVIAAAIQGGSQAEHSFAGLKLRLGLLRAREPREHHD